jgi:hypothetical protein
LDKQITEVGHHPLVAKNKGNQGTDNEGQVMSERVNIAGLDKGAALKALHDGTEPQGMDLLHAIDYLPMEKAQKDYSAAEKRSKEHNLDGMYFDYYYGRPLKVDLSRNDFDPGLYDRDAGEGRAAEVIAQLRAEQAAQVIT